MNSFQYIQKVPFWEDYFTSIFNYILHIVRDVWLPFLIIYIWTLYVIIMWVLFLIIYRHCT